MLKLKRNLLSMALASATVLMATAAQAQSTDNATADKDKTSADNTKVRTTAEKKAQEKAEKEATDLSGVTVTGIRRGIESAIDSKRESTSIVETVSSEDIGKLPDSSIAESIARLPGLTAQRVAGRSSTISIRGLAADFSNTLLNGREQVSSGNNRGVEFDQYPSELISAVTVYKTPDASLVGQGLSGTVNLKTVRPLDFKERVVNFNLRGEKNSTGELNPGYDDTGYRFSASYIDQFADNTVGLAIGYARLDSPGQVNRWNAWGYDPQTVNGATAYSPGGSESYATSSDNVRDGLMAVLEYKPSDFYTGVLDVYYSKYDRSDTIRGLLTGLNNQTNFTADGGRVTGASFSGVKPVVRNDLNTRKDDLFAIGLNNEFRFSEDWTMIADLSLSRANREERILETYAGTVGVQDSGYYTLDPATGLPNVHFGLNYADPSIIVLTDSGGWGQDGYVKYPKFKDELKSLRLSAERSFASGPVSSVEFGLNHADREKSRNVAEAFTDLNTRPTSVPQDLLNPPVDLSFTGIAYGSLSYDVDDAFNRFYHLRNNVNGDILNKDWEIHEKITTFYTQINFDSDLGTVPVKGNIGVQYVHSDQSSDGFSLANGDATNAIPFSGGAKYNDLLPSLNFAFSYPHDQVLRIAMGRQLARPRLDDLRANNNFSVGLDQKSGDFRWSGGGGNPNLKPWKANAYDLSYEKYFGGRGYISVAGFHKDLKTYIISQPIAYDFSAYTVPVGSPVPVTNIGNYTAPSNGEGGRIRGYEVALSLPLDMLWAPLDGFGLQASYSHTMTSINPTNDPSNNPGVSSPLPGFSRNVSNVTAYYEKHGFSTRVSLRERSPFLGEIQGFGADLERVYIDQESIVDFQMGYLFNENTRLKGLSLLLQVNNLTNTPYRQFYRDNTAVRPDLPQTYQEYGRTLLLGASYKF